MPSLIVINRAGDEIMLQAAVGLSLMETIRDGGIPEILAACGGCCSCATCHVYVDEQWFGKVGDANRFEADILDASDHQRPTSRLSCQIRITDELDGLRITISPED
jgi:2Fe-2S ferredoxin